jgi:hypothetical protein
VEESKVPLELDVSNSKAYDITASVLDLDAEVVVDDMDASRLCECILPLT